MKYYYILGVLFLAIAIIGVYTYVGTRGRKPLIEPEPTTSQGIYGKVSLITGNCTPPAGPSCKTSYISRTIYIREPVTIKAMEKGYLKNKTNLAKQIKSNNKGFYEVELSPGTYSVFVEKEGKEYCGTFGGHGEACQIILGNELKEYNIVINRAVW